MSDHTQEELDRMKKRCEDMMNDALLIKMQSKIALDETPQEEPYRTFTWADRIENSLFAMLIIMALFFGSIIGFLAVLFAVIGG